MDFDEIKMIWDSQNEEQMYGFDRDALHRRVKKDGRSTKLLLNAFETVSILFLFGLGVGVSLDPLLDGNNYHQLAEAAFYIGAASFLFGETRRRKREERGFDNSLLGDLDRSIVHVEAQIRWMRGLIWCYLGPMLLITVIKVPFETNLKSILFWTLLATVTIMTFVSSRRKIRNTLRPKKNSLEALREKLVSTESEASPHAGNDEIANG